MTCETVCHRLVLDDGQVVRGRTGLDSRPVRRTSALPVAGLRTLGGRGHFTRALSARALVPERRAAVVGAETRPDRR